MERITIPGVGQFDRHTTALPNDCSQHVRLETVAWAVRRVDLRAAAWTVASFLTGVLSGISMIAGA